MSVDTAAWKRGGSLSARDFSPSELRDLAGPKPPSGESIERPNAEFGTGDGSRHVLRPSFVRAPVK
jgi:hypothetical protein